MSQLEFSDHEGNTVIIPQVFTHPQFGNLETIDVNGKGYVEGAKLAENILGFAAGRNAIAHHCPHALKKCVGVNLILAHRFQDPKG